MIFEGSEGYVVMTTYHSGAAFDRDGEMIQQFKGQSDHFANFLKAVRSRKIEDLNGDIEEGHLSSALCHYGNISYRLGERMGASDAEKQVAKYITTDNATATLERTLAHLKDNGTDLGSIELGVGPMLVLDPKTETFIGNKKADEMLTRAYRKPFVVPAAGEV